MIARGKSCRRCGADRWRLNGARKCEMRYRCAPCHAEYMTRWRREKGQGGEGKCGCCGLWTDRLKRDHDHATGRVRDKLCNNCNLLLGHAFDNPRVLERAFEYLRKWGVV